MRCLRVSVALTALLFAACTPAANVLQSESVVIQGSDTEVQLVSALVESFTGAHSEADMSVTGGGSAVGIAALINGEADIANSSRPMSSEEKTAADANGIDVQEFIVARDGLSVIVHPSNEVMSLTVAQLGSIFRGEVINWQDVGGADAPIVLYGRQSTSGTFGFFRDAVMKADYAQSMRQMEGTEAIVDAVAADENGIGYAGVGYVKDEDGGPREEVAVLPMKLEDGTMASPLNEEDVLSGRYPIARPIYQYLAEKPAAGSVIDAFIRFESSVEGESIIRSMGFYPVSDADRAANEYVTGTAE